MPNKFADLMAISATQTRAMEATNSKLAKPKPLYKLNSSLSRGACTRRGTDSSGEEERRSEETTEKERRRERRAEKERDRGIRGIIPPARRVEPCLRSLCKEETRNYAREELFVLSPTPVARCHRH
jgi:hypothetical protein